MPHPDSDLAAILSQSSQLLGTISTKIASDRAAVKASNDAALKAKDDQLAADQIVIANLQAQVVTLKASPVSDALFTQASSVLDAAKALATPAETQIPT